MPLIKQNLYDRRTQNIHFFKQITQFSLWTIGNRKVIYAIIHKLMNFWYKIYSSFNENVSKTIYFIINASEVLVVWSAKGNENAHKNRRNQDNYSQWRNTFINLYLTVLGLRLLFFIPQIKSTHYSNFKWLQGSFAHRVKHFNKVRTCVFGRQGLTVNTEAYLCL